MAVKLLLRFLIPLLCIVGLTACGVQGSYTDQLPEPQDLSDPRSFEGVTEVSDFVDIEPVSTNAQPALPVELTDADGYDVSVTDVSRILALDIYGTSPKR